MSGLYVYPISLNPRVGRHTLLLVMFHMLGKETLYFLQDKVEYSQ